MTVSTRNTKILWAAAAGRCSFPNCQIQILHPPIGECAHIRGEKLGSARHNSQQSSKESNSYKNLILLCPNHHAEIDNKDKLKIYTVEYLLNIKLEHESKVGTALNQIFFANKHDLAKYVLQFLIENEAVFYHYGPTSDMARKNPVDEKVVEQWFYYRLSTIIPNNRKISSLLKKNKNLFSTAEQITLEKFLLHVDSYENWIEGKGKINYNAVIRFPKKFKLLIEEISNAGK